MSDAFEELFKPISDPEVNTQVTPQNNEDKPTLMPPHEEIEELDGSLVPRLNGLQIVLVIIIVGLLGGFGIFYANRTSAQNNLSSSSLTPIPSQTDASFLIPSQPADTSTTTQQTSPQTQTTEGGQSVAPTPTKTPTTAPIAIPTTTPTPTSQPTPTATNTPTPAPTATPTIAPTNTPSPTDTPTATPTP